MIRAVLDHYGVAVADRPVWQRVRCIVHDDDHASAGVIVFGNHPRMVCHVCGRGWNPVELVMEMEGLDYDAAKQRTEELARNFGEPVQSKPVEGNRLSGKPRSFSRLRTW